MRTATRALGAAPADPIPYDALRAAAEALLLPNALADVRTWGDAVLAALTALVGGTRARLLVELNGRAHVWGDAPAPEAPAGGSGGTVRITVRGGADGGEASFVCALPSTCDAAAGIAHQARASALLGVLRPVLDCALAMRARADRAPAPSGAGAARAGLAAVDGATEQAADLLCDRFALTAREGEVVRLLLRGRRNGEIARALGISSHTARHHTEHVLGKLGVRSRAAVAAVAAQPPALTATLTATLAAARGAPAARPAAR